MSKETIVTCVCGAGVIVRPGKNGVLAGKCPLCSREVSTTAVNLETTEPPAATTSRKRGAHAGT